MSGMLATAPVALFLLAGAVLLVLLGATAARRRQLAPAAAGARRHALTAQGTAVVVAVAAGAATAWGGAGVPWAPGTSLLLAPLVSGIVHTVVLGIGESTWPRPRGDVRTAALRPRTLPPGSRRWRRGFVVATGLVVLTCAVGWSTAADDGRSLITTHAAPAGLEGVVGSSTTGPYPGAAYALPALVGTGVLVLLTWLTLRTAMRRPAVPGGPADENTLRAASVHRVLRAATSALLVLLAGLWFVGGSALLGAGQDVVVGVDDVTYVLEGARIARVVGIAGMVGGTVAGLLALTLLLLPAPRLRPSTPVRPADPVPA